MTGNCVADYEAEGAMRNSITHEREHEAMRIPLASGADPDTGYCVGTDVQKDWCSMNREINSENHDEKEDYAAVY